MKTKQKSQRRVAYKLLLFAILLLTGNFRVSSQTISPYLIGQNSWMPYWFGGDIADHWDEMKTAKYQVIRIGGNAAMSDNKDYAKVIYLIDGVRSAGSEPIVQIPDDYSAAQTIAYYNYINVTMNKGIKLWSIGNEPSLNGRGSITQIADYIKRISSALKSVAPSAIVMGPDEASFNGGDQSAWLGGYADISGKDAAGNYYIDVYTWHTYNFNDIGGIEANVNETVGKLATINANRPTGKKLSWGMGEYNTHWDMAMVTNPDQYTWSFHAGQMFAELYDLGMRKGAYTMCPWAMSEHGGDRSGTDLSLFDGDNSPRSTYWHSLMLGQNMKTNYLTYTDNQNDIVVIPMGDATGISVMILNKSKTATYNYSLKLDMGTVTANALTINVNANVNAQITGTMGAYSTQMLVFCPNGTLQKKYTYTSGNCDAKQAPTVVTYTTTCVTTPPVLTTIAVTPATTSVYNGSSVTFTAQGYDQYGAVIASTPTWTVSGGGTISSSGVFTATTVGGLYTVTATSGTIKGTATVTVATAPVPIALPAKVEAENYTAMYGIQTETTTDAGGGLNVGYTDIGDYMDYYVNVPATGSYTIDFRIASDVTTGKIELRNSSGVALATVSQTVAAGWQGWSTKTVTANLTAGTQTLRIYYTGVGLNVNWFEVKSTTSVLTTITVSPATAALTVGQTQQFTAAGKDQNGAAVTIAPTWTATGGTITTGGLYTATTAGTQTITATSGTISGSATATVTPVATGYAVPGIIQAESYAGMYGIQTETTTDVNGGLNVGWIDIGDYMTYTVNVAAAGTYSVSFRVAGWATTGRISLQNASNTTLTSANVPNGGTGAYQVWSTVNGEGNFTLAAGVQTIRIYATGAPWNLNWFEIKQVTTPVLASITVSPATVTLATGQTQQFTAVGKDQNGATMTIAPIWTATGGTVTTGGLYTATTAGTQTITATSGTISGSATATVTATSSYVIQAESYATMLGIQTETTTDAGGGLNVGWLDIGDYMTYTVNIATAGTYNVNFRLAGWTTTGRISLQNAANTTLTSANVPNGGTNGYQVWSTVHGENTFTLAAGTQTIRIYATGAPWNLNWFEIYSGAIKSASDESEITESSDNKLVIYPNPASDKLYIQTSDDIANANVFDISGKLVISKVLQGGDNEIDISSLKSGMYFININGEVNKFIKKQ
jgi:hypothetical protein